MSPLAKLDRELENLIRNLSQRLVTPDWCEFEMVWEAAHRVCDRYQIGAVAAPALRKSLQAA